MTFCLLLGSSTSSSLVYVSPILRITMCCLDFLAVGWAFLLYYITLWFSMSSLVIQSFSNLHTCRRSSLSGSSTAAAPPFARLVNSPTKCVPRYVLLLLLYGLSRAGVVVIWIWMYLYLLGRNGREGGIGWLWGSQVQESVVLGKWENRCERKAHVLDLIITIVVVWMCLTFHWNYYY